MAQNLQKIKQDFEALSSGIFDQLKDVEKRADVAEQRNQELEQRVADLEKELQSERVKNAKNQQRIERIRAVLDGDGEPETSYQNGTINGNLDEVGSVDGVSRKRPRNEFEIEKSDRSTQTDSNTITPESSKKPAKNKHIAVKTRQPGRPSPAHSSSSSVANSLIDLNPINSPRTSDKLGSEANPDKESKKKCRQCGKKEALQGKKICSDCYLSQNGKKN